MEIATLGCAVRVKLSEDKQKLEDVRLAYGVAGPTPLRCYDAEDALRGKDVSDDTIFETFGKLALTQVNPRSSWRASKEFRLQLIEELAKRGLYQALLLAGGIPDASCAKRYSGTWKQETGAAHAEDGACSAEKKEQAQEAGGKEYA